MLFNRAVVCRSLSPGRGVDTLMQPPVHDLYTATEAVQPGNHSTSRRNEPPLDLALERRAKRTLRGSPQEYQLPIEARVSALLYGNWMREHLDSQL